MTLIGLTTHKRIKKGYVKVVDDYLTVIAKQRSPKPNRISHRTPSQPPVREIEKCDSETLLLSADRG